MLHYSPLRVPENCYTIHTNNEGDKEMSEGLQLLTEYAGIIKYMIGFVVGTMFGVVLVGIFSATDEPKTEERRRGKDPVL
jgi:hypothetical protein